MIIYSLHPCGTSRILLHAVKSYDMGRPALLPIRTEGVLPIFITFKTPSPWPSSNPQTLGPVAGTLTATPPRRLHRYFTYSQVAGILRLLAARFAHLTPSLVLHLNQSRRWCNISYPRAASLPREKVWGRMMMVK
jgi:hypothetical protein